MSKYVFPAILFDDAGQIGVRFPDLPTCVTCGTDLTDALEMAEDALSLVLVNMEDRNVAIPAPSAMGSLDLAAGESSTLVKADTLHYRRETSSRAVK